MKNVLCFQHLWRLWRDRLAGIYRYAARARWRMQLVVCDPTEGFPLDRILAVSHDSAVRIARAKALLLRRNVALETLQGLCGYGDPSSLRRAFKKATGLSPRQWRKAHSGHPSESVCS